MDNIKTDDYNKIIQSYNKMTKKLLDHIILDIPVNYSNHKQNTIPSLYYDDFHIDIINKVIDKYNKLQIKLSKEVENRKKLIQDIEILRQKCAYDTETTSTFKSPQYKKNFEDNLFSFLHSNNSS